MDPVPINVPVPIHVSLARHVTRDGVPRRSRWDRTVDDLAPPRILLLHLQLRLTVFQFSDMIFVVLDGLGFGGVDGNVDFRHFADEGGTPEGCGVLVDVLKSEMNMSEYR